MWRRLAQPARLGLTLTLTLILTLTLTPNPNPKPKPHQISPHEMGDDALLSRTAALGLIARAHFGRDASHEVRTAAPRARGCNPACAQAATLHMSFHITDIDRSPRIYI